MIARIQQAKLKGSITVPASKSHCIRALFIAALAEGESYIDNYLESEDTKSGIRAIRNFGADLRSHRNRLIVRGLGVNAKSGRSSLPKSENILDVANSGTTLFFATGIAALSPQYTFFTGDEQIRKRSAENLLTALNKLGAKTISTKNNGCAPFAVAGPLGSGNIRLSCPVSQYLSSLMIACPLMREGSVADIRITLLNERPYVEMTAQWLRDQDIFFENRDFQRIRIPGGQQYRAFSKVMPGDFSSATFFACAVAIGGGQLELKNLDIHDNQGDKRIFQILQEMGCVVEYGDNAIRIESPLSGILEGGVFDLNDIPDSLPALAITSAFARGETRLINVPQARLKECDRIATMAVELKKLGVSCQELPDGLVILGAWPEKIPLHQKTKNYSPNDPLSEDTPSLRLCSHKDHRIAMACSLAGLAAELPIEVDEVEAISVTFPNFFELLDSCTQSPIGGSAVLSLQ